MRGITNAVGGGGLKEFFGDGSDGTIPNLNTATSAPNGGTVANLWDMNAGTVFTTGTLSSASDQVVFSIDFGKPIFLPSTASFQAYYISISTGAARTARVEISNDGSSWSTLGSGSITTTVSGGLGVSGNNNSYRYLRLVLASGGSSCTMSIQGITLNYLSGDTQTTKVWRILEPSTLNGGAVIKQYTSYTLPVGYEHTVQNPCQGLIIYSQGDVTVNGIIDMSQKAGLAPNGNPIPMIIAPSYIKTSKTSSLLHFDNNITDDNGRVWTNNGSATFDATNKKFGTHAISFNGTSQWIDTPASDDFSFGSDDFTIDFWMRFTSTATLNIFGSVSSTGSFGSITLTKTSGGFLQININSKGTGGYEYTNTTTLVLNTNQFYHISIVRNGQDIILYVDGLKQFVINGVNNIYKCANKFTIGRDGEYTSNYFAGQIDEFRIIKGKAMYTSNFTPPSSAYVYQATFSDEVEAFKEYYQMTTRLQMLRGGYGGSAAGYGGGYSGSTGRQTSVGIGGAGRQNLGGFGGGGSGGATSSANAIGGVGGSILNSELSGGNISSPRVKADISVNARGIDGIMGAGATGGATGSRLTEGFIFLSTGIAYGGGTGGTGGLSTTGGTNSSDSQYAGGFLAVICKGNFLNVGTIRANGGNGSNGSNGAGTNTGGGGGGSGSGAGCIAIFNKGTYTNSGTLQLNGGAGGSGGSGVGTGEAGGSGSSGSANVPVIQQI